MALSAMAVESDYLHLYFFVNQTSTGTGGKKGTNFMKRFHFYTPTPKRKCKRESSWKNRGLSDFIATFIVFKYGLVPYNPKIPTGSLPSGKTGSKPWKAGMDTSWDPKEGIFYL